MGGGTTVDTARKQDHVRAKVPDALDLLMGEALVVRCDHIHNDRAGAESGPFGRLSGHRSHHTGHHHLQTAAGRRGRDVNIGSDLVFCRRDKPVVFVEQFPSGQLFDFGDRIQHTHGDVLERRFHRGGGFASGDQSVLAVYIFNKNRLGGSGAAVGGDNDFDIFRIRELSHQLYLPVRSVKSYSARRLSCYLSGR